MNQCKCGCGGIVNPGKKFIWHHNRRGAKLTSDQVKANSARNSGKNNPMYGVRLTGKQNGFYGKQHTNKTKEKIRQARLGTKASEETKRKVSEAGKGRKHSTETKLKISESNTGKKMSAESRNKMSIIRLLRIAQKEKDYCDEWRDKEFKHWVKYERDGGVCQECGDKPTNPRLVHLHHIDGFKKSCHPHNLITLCMSCHMSYHCILEKEQLIFEWTDTANQNTKEYYNEL